LMCRTLKDYEVELNDPHFLRCHKSYIVNRLYIKEIVKDSQNYMLLSNGTQIPIARRKSIHIVNSLL
jgi:two-component system LytT family response regulator